MTARSSFRASPTRAFFGAGSLQDPRKTYGDSVTQIRTSCSERHDWNPERSRANGREAWVERTCATCATCATCGEVELLAGPVVVGGVGMSPEAAANEWAAAFARQTLSCRHETVFPLLFRWCYLDGSIEQQVRETTQCTDCGAAVVAFGPAFNSGALR